MLINLRNALMAGKRLPYDAELEYLESTGTQWINTGLELGQNFKLHIDVNTDTTSWEKNLLGNIIQYSSGVLTIGIYNYFVFAYLNGALRIDSNSLGEGNKDIDITYTQNTTGRSLNVNGVDYTSASVVNPSNNQLSLFCKGDGRDVVKMKLRHFEFWKDGVLIQDLIPVRKGTTGEMYDRVSGKFAERHGDFVVGPDVVPVEYIESHGTEYIDTGVYGSQNLRTTFDYQLMYSGTAPAQKGLFGCFSSGAKYFLYCSGESTPHFQVGMGSVYTNTVDVDNLRHSIEYNNSEVSIDGNVVATYEQYGTQTTHTLLLFALHNPSGGLYSMTPMRKWRVQMWDNGTPIRDYVPVRVGTGSTWEGAMMDVLNRRVYRNAGTGAFSYGNDLKYPIAS